MPHTNPMTDDLNEPKSKSQRKRESTELQALGRRLVELSPSRRAAIALPPALREAIEHAASLQAHGAKRRQLQYIGKLMREIDAEPIRQALESLQDSGRQEAQRFQRIERWRDRLLAEGDAAVEALLDEYPAADRQQLRQQLRQLLRNARREADAGKPPSAARSLFRYLRGLDEG